MPKITKLIAGQSPTLLQASTANELIDYINGLLSSASGDDYIQVNVASDGKITISINIDELDDLFPEDLPDGSNGDIMYYNGGWTTLSAGPSGSVLRSNGSGLYWDSPATCE